MAELPADSLALIDEFVYTEWPKLSLQYDVVRKEVVRLFSNEAASIKFILMSRTKEAESIQKTARRRLAHRMNQTGPEGGPYTDTSQIINDMHDLAGIRIALYMPDQEEDVDKFVNERLRKVEETPGRPNPSIWGKNSKQAPYPGGYEDTRYFTGYMARHYRVTLGQNKTESHEVGDAESLKAKTLPFQVGASVTTPDQSSSTEGLANLSDLVVEIQVASVMMHAWAEVHHDMIYKPEMSTGLPMRPQQSRFLDMINGLAMTSQLSLMGLKADLDQQRGEFSRIPFDVPGLSDHLKRTFRPDERGEFSSLTQMALKLLHQSLEAFEINTPERLDPLLAKCDLAAKGRRQPSLQLVCITVLEALGEKDTRVEEGLENSDNLISDKQHAKQRGPYYWASKHSEAMTREKTTALLRSKAAMDICIWLNAYILRSAFFYYAADINDILGCVEECLGLEWKSLWQQLFPDLTRGQTPGFDPTSEVFWLSCREFSSILHPEMQSKPAATRLKLDRVQPILDRPIPNERFLHRLSLALAKLSWAVEDDHESNLLIQSYRLERRIIAKQKPANRNKNFRTHVPWLPTQLRLGFLKTINRKEYVQNADHRMRHSARFWNDDGQLGVFLGDGVTAKMHEPSIFAWPTRYGNTLGSF